MARGTKERTERRSRKRTEGSFLSDSLQRLQRYPFHDEVSASSIQMLPSAEEEQDDNTNNASVVLNSDMTMSSCLIVPA